MIGNRTYVSDSSKLLHLKNSLRGYAFKTVEHLPEVGSSYPIAIGILKSHFLDTDFLVNFLIKEVYKGSSFDGKELKKIRNFLSTTHSHLHELKELGLDCSEGPVTTVISTLVTDRLPSIFLRELKLITLKEFPI